MVDHNHARGAAPRIDGGTVRSLVTWVLVVSWTAVVLVDVFDVLGVREAITDAWSPSLFQHLGQNSGPLEWVQWALLIAGAIVAATTAGALRERGDTEVSRSAQLLSVLLAVLVISDAGGPRHVVSDTLERFVSGAAGSASEAVIFGAMTVFALFVLRAVLATWTSERAKSLLMLGYVFYFAAAAMSFTGNWWYGPVGDAVVIDALGDPYPHWVGAGFFFFDSLVEESVELIAAGLLVASTMALCDEASVSRPFARSMPVADGELTSTG